MHVHDILAAIPLDRQSGTPLFRQLYLQLKDAILAGDIAAAVRLPATRELAASWASRARPCWRPTSS
jgi:GntR family transcriptional regulator/MocR family aminotransferase